MKESTIKVVRDERGRFVKAAPTPRPFKVGDVVRMSRKGKRKYDNWRRNPHNAIGSITGEGNMPGWFGVKWNNGEWNDYQPHEIELVHNAPKQRKAEETAEAPKFKIGDMVTGITCTQMRATGEIIKIDHGCLDGMHYCIKTAEGWEPWMEDKGLKKVVSVDIDLTVPEEIPAALQTLAKAFGYRVEKA